MSIVENDLYDQYVSDAGKAMIEEAKKGIADGSSLLKVQSVKSRARSRLRSRNC